MLIFYWVRFWVLYKAKQGFSFCERVVNDMNKNVQSFFGRQMERLTCCIADAKGGCVINYSQLCLGSMKLIRIQMTQTW